MSGDLLRLVDSIHRDKDIDKDIIFDALEDALLSAARRYYGPKSDMAVFVDRESGNIQAFDGNEEVDGTHLGRIAAQSAKQVIIQRIRDAEQDSLFREYESRVKQIVSGTIQRFEGSTIIVNLGRAEGILPRSEQVQEEGYRIGERIRCLLLEVRRMGTRVRILLSRANHDLIRRLFELEVPEIGERVIEIMAIAREPGHRTKVAVASADIKVDCVGACVGVRGSRIKNIVAELNDEKIDIVRWSDARDQLIANSLKPAEIREVIVSSELNRARVVVPEEELSLAIGKRGRNVRLAAKLCEVDIDILSEAEGERELKDLNTAFGELEGLPERFPQRVYQMGYSVEDIAEGARGWAERFDLDEDIVAMVVERSKTAAVEIAEARAQAEAEAAEAEAQAEAEAAEAEAQAEAEAAQAEAAEAEAPEQEGTDEDPDADAEPDADEGAEAQPDDADAEPDATEDAALPEPDAEQSEAGDPPTEELPAAPDATEPNAADHEPTADDTDAPGGQAA
ncbi:transcription termination factor NusA, partial [bacterium]|nr:transcription termination factor NusA [bacterium]